MTPEVRYEPGRAFLCAGPRGCCFTSDRQLAVDFWPILSGQDPADIFDQALRAGLMHVAELVLVEVDGQDARVLVRGQQVSVITDQPDGARFIDGRAVRTWVEQAVPSAAVLSVGVCATGSLPLSSGVVTAGAFQWMRTSENPKPMPEKVGTVGGGVAEPAPTHLRAQPNANPPRSETVAPAASAPANESTDAEVFASEPEPPASEAVSPLPPDPTKAESAAASSPELPGVAGMRTGSETRTVPADEGYDHLFESTILRSVEDAAVRPVEETGGLISSVPGVSAPASETGEGPPVSGSTTLGDHDGSTILAGQVAVLRAAAESREVPPTRPGKELVLSTGAAVLMDRPIILGRLPQADRVTEGSLPHLVTVPSRDGGISRSHVRVATEGQRVTVTDLLSTNGSLLRRSDGSVDELTGGNSLAFEPGDVLEFGDNITAYFRLLE